MVLGVPRNAGTIPVFCEMLFEDRERDVCECKVLSVEESRAYCDLEGASKMKLQLPDLSQAFRKEDDQ